MQTTPTTPSRSPLNRRLLAAAAVLAVGALLLIGVSLPSQRAALPSAQPQTDMVGQLLVLALPTFLAGVFSFLSPCTLPILPAYFAFTFGAKRQQLALMTLAFFLGLATTMTILGAGVSLLGNFTHSYRDQLTFWGGLLVIGLGLMSMLGKGFSGLRMTGRPTTTFAGTYLYGMTFALGWTACIGPILGALLTMLATQGGTVIVGAALAFIYTLGLALPLLFVAIFFNRVGTGTRFWQMLKGRGWTVRVFNQTLYLHSTSLISGLLLVLMGALLMSGRLALLTTWAASGTDFGGRIQEWLADIFKIGQ